MIMKWRLSDVVKGDDSWFIGGKLGAEAITEAGWIYREIVYNRPLEPILA